jgi:hypothetical protein
VLKVGTKIVSSSGKTLTLTPHAVDEALKGGINTAQILQTINKGEVIKYSNNYGNVTAYRNAIDGTFVAVGDNGQIITVIENTSSSYLNNILKNPIYGPYKL